MDLVFSWLIAIRSAWSKAVHDLCGSTSRLSSESLASQERGAKPVVRLSSVDFVWQSLCSGLEANSSELPLPSVHELRVHRASDRASAQRSPTRPRLQRFVVTISAWNLLNWKYLQTERSKPNISLKTDTNSWRIHCMPAQGSRQQCLRQAWRKRQTVGAA